LFGYFTGTQHRFKLIKKISSIKNMLNYELKFILEVLITNLKYFDGYFNSSYEQLMDLVPFEIIQSFLLNKDNELMYYTGMHALLIYEMEGKTYEVLKCLNDTKSFDFTNYYALLFRLGLYKELESIMNEDEDCNGFFKYEILYNSGCLNVLELSNYVDNLYKKQSIEIMQCHYILAKAGHINKEKIQKLVVVNPYTNGLKQLMKAFIEEDESIVKKYYEDAIKNLEHIKYYYLEAILYYCKFLKISDPILYNDKLNVGLRLSNEYKYWFLLHQFSCLKNDEEKEFRQGDYPFFDIDVTQYMEDIRQYIKRKNRNKVEKVKQFKKAF